MMGLAPSGSNYKGRPLYWRRDQVTDVFEFHYLGRYLKIPALLLMQDMNYLHAWCDKAYMESRAGGAVASPGYFGSNQLGSLSNGLSGQAAQALPSHPYGAQSGNSYSAAAQLAAQQAAYTLAMRGIAGGRYGSVLGDEPLQPLKTEGFRCGEIIAHRGWRVSPDGFLRSMSADVIWGPGEPMEGKTTSKREHNGVYAFKNLRDLLKDVGSSVDAYGKVALWGDIIEHELGYRAQFAKIISVDGYTRLDRPHGIPLKRIQSRYQLSEAA